MSNRVAAVIVNFNMPERADALAEFIESHVDNPCDVILVDNGSDQVAPSQHTTLRIEKNMQTTFGWLAGLEWADLWSNLNGYKYFAYWFLITSAEFVGRADPLTPMVEFMERHEDVVGIHPALTKDSTTSWEHMKERRPFGFRETWMIDNIASLYRADWFNSIGRFDPALRFAWGIDLETCWKARMQGKRLFLNETVPVKKVTNIGYKMDRMGMSAQDREQRAGLNMAHVLSERYGPDWWSRMTNEYVKEEQR